MTENIMTPETFSKHFLSLPSPLQSIIIETSGKMEELYRSDHIGTDIAETETRTVELTRQMGIDLFGSIIEKRDDGAPRIVRDGQSWYRVEPSRGILTCLLGKVVYRRSLYRCRRARNSICPVDDSLCLLPGSMTRPAGKLASYMVAECPPRNCRGFFEQAGGMNPSVSSLQRLLSSLHGTWQGIEEDALDDIRSGEVIPQEATQVSVSLDGVKVHLRKGEYPIGIDPERDKSDTSWRDAACGTVSLHDKEGNVLRTISSGRMPEKKKWSLKRWLKNEFEPIMKARPDLTLVGIADGADDNWDYLDSMVPDEQVLDFYHATQHLHKASAHAVTSKKWFGKWRSVLCHEPGGVERVIRAIRGLHERSRNDKARKELWNVLNYFRSHRHRMNYAELKRRGIPIGSGIVEAVNKTHVGERLKKSGMRWGMEGGQAVLTFRSLVKSNRFDSAWDRIMVAIDKGEPDNDNRQMHDLAKAA